VADNVGPQQPDILTIPIRGGTVISAATEKKMDSNWPIFLIAGVGLLAWYVLKDSTGIRSGK